MYGVSVHQSSISSIVKELNSVDHPGTQGLSEIYFFKSSMFVCSS